MRLTGVVKKWLGESDENPGYFLVELESSPDTLPYSFLDEIAITVIIKEWDRVSPVRHTFDYGIPLLFPVSVLGEMVSYFSMADLE